MTFEELPPLTQKRGNIKMVISVLNLVPFICPSTYFLVGLLVYLPHL